MSLLFYCVHQIKCAVALCEYYNWLEKQVKLGKDVTEVSASEKLETYRKWVWLYHTKTLNDIYFK